MQSKHKLSFGYIIIAILAFAVIWQWAAMRGMKLELVKFAAIGQQWKIELLVNNLRIPSEALYYDSKAMREIAKIRKKYYEQHGTERFLPYTNVVENAYLIYRDTERHAYATYGDSKAFPTNDESAIINQSFENWWLNRAVRCVNGFGRDIEYNRRLGAYLNDNPQEFRRVVRPWLVRMTEAYHPKLALVACRTLLAQGDRSTEVSEAVSRLIHMQHPLAKDAMQVNIEYGLGIEVPEGLGDIKK